MKALQVLARDGNYIQTVPRLLPSDWLGLAWNGRPRVIAAFLCQEVPWLILVRPFYEGRTNRKLQYRYEISAGSFSIKYTPEQEPKLWAWLHRRIGLPKTEFKLEPEKCLHLQNQHTAIETWLNEENFAPILPTVYRARGENFNLELISDPLLLQIRLEKILLPSSATEQFVALMSEFEGWREQINSSQFRWTCVFSQEAWQKLFDFAKLFCPQPEAIQTGAQEWLTARKQRRDQITSTQIKPGIVAIRNDLQAKHAEFA